MGQYEIVTEKIVTQLEAGVRPWVQGWSGTSGAGRPRRSNGVPYRGINALYLWLIGMQRGFTACHWVTYKGALELNAQVKKGAKSEPAFYSGQITKEEAAPDGSGDGVERAIRFMKSYRVFNADEVLGLPGHFYAPPPRPIQKEGRWPDIDDWIFNTGATCRYSETGGAFFRPSDDFVQMPTFERFPNAAEYYSTHFHELAHWTGDAKRLARTMSMEKVEYAREELVAELAAAFLSLDHGISTEPREDHAAYIAGWITWLKSDPKAIFTAAAHAEKAAQYLHDLQPALQEIAA